MTLTLNKEFLHPVFIVSNRRHIACYIHISRFLVPCCKNYQDVLQNMSKGEFQICPRMDFDNILYVEYLRYNNYKNEIILFLEGC